MEYELRINDFCWQFSLSDEHVVFCFKWYALLFDANEGAYCFTCFKHGIVDLRGTTYSNQEKVKIQLKVELPDMG